MSILFLKNPLWPRITFLWRCLSVYLSWNLAALISVPLFSSRIQLPRLFPHNKAAAHNSFHFISLRWSEFWVIFISLTLDLKKKCHIRPPGDSRRRNIRWWEKGCTNSNRWSEKTSHIPPFLYKTSANCCWMHLFAQSSRKVTSIGQRHLR